MDYLSLINKKSRLNETKLEKSKKKTEEETVWKRLRNKLRKPLLDYQEHELLRIGFITCINRQYLVRESHSVRYPTLQKIDNHSWSVLLQWLICLTLSSEDLVGFCCNSFVPIPILAWKKKNRGRGTSSKILVASITWQNKVIKKRLS